MFRISLIYIFILFLAHIPTANSEQINYFIGIPCFLESKPDCKIPDLENVFAEMYKRAGVVANFVYLPSKRDLYYANEGIIDASFVRTSFAISKYPNLINLSLPLGKSNNVAITLNQKLNINKAEDLSGLTIGILDGNVILKNFAKEVGCNYDEAKSFKHLMKKLEYERIDAIIVENVVINAYFKDKAVPNIKISPSLLSVNLYHAINRKHKDVLKPKLDKALQEMISDGTFKKLLGQFSDFEVFESK